MFALFLWGGVFAAVASDNSIRIFNDVGFRSGIHGQSQFPGSSHKAIFLPYAQAVISGEAIPTQCDVKTRWPDGSLQHAVLSFWTAVPVGDPVRVEFVNQEVDPNTAPALDRDCHAFRGLQVRRANRGGEWNYADRRRSRHAGSLGRQRHWQQHVRYWLRGPICTQVIIEDRTPARSFDMGFTSHKSLHPIFVATFYPGWSSVKVEMILENIWFSTIQDQTYSVTLRTGNAENPVIKYTDWGFRHSALTRWRKVYWSGQEPNAIHIDYNLPYLVSSKALPNYDVTKSLSQKAVNEEITAFAATESRYNLASTAQWQTKMWAGGANERGDIGLMPRWYIRYLYSFDPGLYRVMIGNAEASGGVPIHFRDSVPGIFFDTAKTTESFGRVLSVEGRLTVRTGKWVGDSIAQDEIRPIGPIADNVWNPDQQHQPSFAYVPYLITGDWYFLEEMYFWAAWNVAWPNPTLSYNKGEYTRYGAFGYLNENGIEARGAAWTLRTLGETAFLAPDGSPEKKYFTRMMDNNIAVREGVYDIRDGAFCNPDQTGACTDPRWKWGRKAVGADMPNPLYLVSVGAACSDGGQVCDSDVNPAKATRANSPWMFNYTHAVWGRLREMGFPIAKLQSTTAKSLLHQILDPTYNPYMVEEYRIPTTDKAGNYFTSWRTLAEAYLSSDLRLAKREFSIFPSLVEGSYVHIARGAASYLVRCR